MYDANDKHIGGCGDFMREAKWRGWVERVGKRHIISEEGRAALAAYRIWEKTQQT